MCVKREHRFISASTTESYAPGFCVVFYDLYMLHDYGAQTDLTTRIAYTLAVICCSKHT